MKRMCRLLTFAGVLLVIFNLYPQYCNAQGDPGDDPDAPIDGGVGVLVAAGIGYGIKKVKDKRRKNNTANLPEKNI